MKKILISLVALLCVAGGNSQSAEDYYNRGNENAAIKDYSGAISAYSAAIMREPGFSDALFMRATSYMEMQLFGKAILDLNKVTELRPDYAEAYNSRGMARMGIQTKFRGDDTYIFDNELVADLTFAITPNMDKIYFLYKDKITELLNKDTSGMLIREYFDDMQVDPQNPRALFCRGVMKMKYEDCEGGMADVLKAIEIQPAYKDSVLLCTNPKGYANAIADFTKAIELKPKYAEAYYRRGIANIKSGNEEACDDLSRAEELGDNRATGLVTIYCK